MRLCHGTTKESAEKIKTEGKFLIVGDKASWCGKGCYFYDNKSKAHWAAKRKCREEQIKVGKKFHSEIVFIDIEDLGKDAILDLRTKKGMGDFKQFVNQVDNKINVCLKNEKNQVVNKEEAIIETRAMLIDFFAKKYNIKLVIGGFRQRSRADYKEVIEFADGYDMVLGIENIFCVKNNDIITRIY